MEIDFKINAKVEVLSIDNQKIGNGKIQDLGTDSIFISYPSGEQSVGMIGSHEILKILYIDDESHKVYSFQAEIINRIHDRIPLLEIKKPTQYELIQRRESVRVNVILDLLIYIIPQEIDLLSIREKDIEMLMKYYKKIKAYSFDLSAGGIGVVLKERQIEGTQLFFYIQNNYFKEGFKGKVARVIENKRFGKRLYKTGIQLLDLDYKTEEQLIHFIFEKMRENLRSR